MLNDYTGSLIFYQVPFTNKDNFCIEDLGSYLSGVNHTSEIPYQFVKETNMVEIDVQINLDFMKNYSSHPDYKNYNYVKLQSKKQVEAETNYTFDTLYYFVESRKYISQSCTQFHLVLDVVNSFQLSNYTVSDKTLIKRQHKNRFTKDSGRVYRNIQRLSEGDYTLYQNNFQVINKYVSPNRSEAQTTALNTLLASSFGVNGTEYNGKFYLVYSKYDNVQTETDNPIRIYLYSDNANVSTMYPKYVPTTQEGEMTWYSIIEVGEVPSISGLDRSQDKLIKIIELPYIPADIDIYTEPVTQNQKIRINGFCSRSHTQYVELNPAQITPVISRTIPNEALLNNPINIEQFSNIKGLHGANLKIPAIEQDMKVENYIVTPSACLTLAKNENYESQLLHSSYNNRKYSFCGNSLVIRREKLDPAKMFACGYFSQYDIYCCMVVSLNTASDVMFAFPFYQQCIKDNEQDISAIITDSHNKEYPLVNDAYISYLRNQASYDEQKKVFTQIGSVVASLGSSVGLVASAMTGNVAGAIGSVGGLISGVKGIISADSDLQNKVNQLKNQAASVVGINDLDIMKASGNRLYAFDYKVCDVDKNNLWNMFYYTGYKCDENGTPNTNTRMWWNYLQADLIFKGAMPTYINEFNDLLKEKYSEGVTIFHAREINGVKHWNVEQTLENIETILVEE